MAQFKVPTHITSHSRKVCSLYKKLIRNYEAYFVGDYTEYRYRAVMMRAKFDENKDIKDLRVAKRLLHEGEEWLFTYQHPQPLCFPDSPGGCAYEREVEVQDTILDFWHPTEKAMYPKYFALREKRKKEYKEFYNRQYPDAPRHFEEH